MLRFQTVLEHPFRESHSHSYSGERPGATFQCGRIGRRTDVQGRVFNVTAAPEQNDVRPRRSRKIEDDFELWSNVRVNSDVNYSDLKCTKESGRQLS